MEINAKKKGNRLALLAVVIIAIFVLLGVMLRERAGAHFGGIEYFMDDEAYAFEYFEKDGGGECILQFDYHDPEAAVGQVVYEDDSTEIVVTDVEVESKNEVTFWFEASGRYDFEKGEGRFLSPVCMTRDSGGAWAISGIPQDALDIGPEGQYFRSSDSATTAFETARGDGFAELKNPFSVSVAVIEQADGIGAEDEKDRPVTVTFCELHGMAWHRR